jgi:hypothetical protein
MENSMKPSLNKRWVGHRGDGYYFGLLVDWRETDAGLEVYVYETDETFTGGVDGVLNLIESRVTDIEIIMFGMTQEAPQKVFTQAASNEYRTLVIQH